MKNPNYDHTDATGKQRIQANKFFQLEPYRVSMSASEILSNVYERCDYVISEIESVRGKAFDEKTFFEYVKENKGKPAVKAILSGLLRYVEMFNPIKRFDLYSALAITGHVRPGDVIFEYSDTDEESFESFGDKNSALDLHEAFANFGFSDSELSETFSNLSFFFVNASRSSGFGKRTSFEVRVRTFHGDEVRIEYSSDDGLSWLEEQYFSDGVLAFYERHNDVTEWQIRKYANTRYS